MLSPARLSLTLTALGAVLPLFVRRARMALVITVALLASGMTHAALSVDVTVEGVDGVLLNNVHEYLSIEKQRQDPNLTENQVQRLHLRAATEIGKALQPFGYYHSTVESSLRAVDGKWLAHYRIDPGPPVIVQAITLHIDGEGTHDPGFQELIAAFPVAEGDILFQPLYDNGKKGFQRYASDHGYFDFQWLTSEIALDTRANRAVINLHADSGVRYRFGKVNFIHEDLRTELLQRYVPFQEDDPYDTIQLLDLQRAYLDSDYFSSVEINPRRDLSAEQRIPVDATLVSRYKHLYSVGLGYGTDTGTRGKLGYENRRVNDRGHRFNTDYKASEILDSLTVRYTIPIRNPRTDQFAITSSWSYDHPETSRSEKYLLGVSRSVDRGNNWLETVYLNYQTETYQVGSDSGDSVLLMPGITWTKVTADNRIYPMRGLRLLADVRGAHPVVVSNVQFLQVRGQAKFIHKLFGVGRILLRGDAGTTRFGSIRSLPTSVRFFTGGDQSVRGYDYNSLAPRNAAGEIIGGEQLLVGSVEYEHRVTTKWSAAVFYDTGNAINNWQDALKKSAGIGARWVSPIGPIRLDLAWSITDPGNPWHPHIHFNLGPDL